MKALVTIEREVYFCDICKAEIGESADLNTCDICGRTFCNRHGSYITNRCIHCHDIRNIYTKKLIKNKEFYKALCKYGKRSIMQEWKEMSLKRL